MFDWQAEMFALSIAPKAATAPPPPAPSVLPTISFAHALTASHKSVPNAILPTPTIMGETLSIKITQDLYERGMNFCKTNLRGRLVLNKGEKPYSTKEIELKLQNHRKTAESWRMMSLGRGYYEFFFASKMDKCNVWVAGTVSLQPGILRLFEWSNDFNMHTQRNTHAQVWIRLLELPQEYWMEQTLREIASAVGTPLVIDNATSKRLFGHYARILVDMDFSRKIFHEIVVEREGYAFPVVVAYEWMPDFCSHCQNIGHDVTVCRRLYPRKVNTKVTTSAKEQITVGKKQVQTKKDTWIPRTDNPSGIGSFLTFGTTNDTLLQHRFLWKRKGKQMMTFNKIYTFLIKKQKQQRFLCKLNHLRTKRMQFRPKLNYMMRTKS